MVEVLRLLQKNMVFHQNGAARIRLQRIFIIRHNHAMLRRHLRMRAAGNLVQLTAVADLMQIVGRIAVACLHRRCRFYRRL